MGEESAVGADDDFLASVLAEAGEDENEEAEVEVEALRSRKKKRKGGLISAVLHGTMDEARQAYIESPATVIPASDAGSPGKVRRTPPSRPQFATPRTTGSHREQHEQPDNDPVEFDLEPTMEVEEPPTPAPTVQKPPSPKKKKTRVVQMLTEDEIDEIESTTDGSKDHLKVSKPKIDAEEWRKVRRSTHELQEEVKIATDVVSSLCKLPSFCPYCLCVAREG
jgi:hypothetical protein